MVSKLDEDDAANTGLVEQITNEIVVNNEITVFFIFTPFPFIFTIVITSKFYILFQTNNKLVGRSLSIITYHVNTYCRFAMNFCRYINQIFKSAKIHSKSTITVDNLIIYDIIAFKDNLKDDRDG